MLPQLLSISNKLSISYSNCPCMVALTFDRVVAISLPFKHRTLFTKWVCIGICVAVWLPQVLFYCWFIGTMFTNEETVSVSINKFSWLFEPADWLQYNLGRIYKIISNLSEISQQCDL